MRSHLPNSTIVFDHFHVIKFFNEKLTEFRREMYREATDLPHKNVLKGTRWLLLKNPKNLSDKRNERARLEEALSLNKPSATAYYMKEDLRLLWCQPDKATAENYLQDWISRAETSGIKILKGFANTLRTHRRGIIAYYDHRISTGPLERTNNKIKTLQRQAYGFRDKLFFMLRIYALHTTRYELMCESEKCQTRTFANSLENYWPIDNFLVDSILPLWHWYIQVDTLEQ